MAVEAPPAPVQTQASPAAPAKPDAAAPALNPMEKAFARMEESAVEADLSAPDPMKTVRQKPKPAPKPEPTKKDEKPATTSSIATPEGDPLETETSPAPAGKEDVAPPKPGEEELTADELKASKPPQQAGPWKLKKYWEKRAAAVEQELAEARKKVADSAKADDVIKRAADIEKRNAELEEEIRYHNFAKSTEFAEKYEQPWKDGWAEAGNTISQLNMTLEDGSVRKGTAQDLLALYQLPLDQLDDTAERLFGKSARRVVNHVEKLQDMAKAQAKALEGARKMATERGEKMTATQQAAQRESADLWNRFNTEIGSKLDILKPKEGDDEWNGKLTAATKLVDESFAHDPTDPSLAPEQRAEIIKKRVALRNRAIGYSTLNLEVKRLRAELAKEREKNKQYEETGPNGGNGTPGTAATEKPGLTPMDRAFQRLEKASVPIGGRFY
jgi:hypothetical protein